MGQFSKRVSAGVIAAAFIAAGLVASAATPALARDPASPGGQRCIQGVQEVHTERPAYPGSFEHSLRATNTCDITIELSVCTSGSSCGYLTLVGPTTRSVMVIVSRNPDEPLDWDYYRVDGRPWIND